MKLVTYADLQSTYEAAQQTGFARLQKVKLNEYGVSYLCWRRGDIHIWLKMSFASGIKTVLSVYNRPFEAKQKAVFECEIPSHISVESQFKDVPEFWNWQGPEMPDAISKALKSIIK